MEIEKYTTSSLSVSAILGFIESKDIAIPEIQRPFVWKKKQVRDLLDSLYKGYPTGYLIIWKNPNVKLKDGTVSSGKKVLIDGQQRVTALMTAIAGIPVINSDYKTEPVKIAFDPFNAFSEDRDAELFAVQDSSHLKSKRWIPDISVIFKNDFDIFSFITNYCADNPDMSPMELSKVITRLKAISNRQVGVIELSDQLNIDVVTDIFIRINSKGTALSQGDFVMSKIAADETHGGNMLRKVIDYFAHLAIAPAFHNTIVNIDTAFASTEYMPKLTWLKDYVDNVFNPTCDDVLRIAFMHKFPRAKLAELVSLLSGRDFESRDFKEEIIDDTYVKLKEGILNVVNENNFKQFMLALKGAGFVSPKLINSHMALDFAYTLYLLLAKSKEVNVGEIKSIVQRWYVLSVLTGRYSSSPESAFAKDLKSIHELGVVETLKNIEAATLSDTFWEVKVVQDLAYSSTNNPTYLIYLAAQVMLGDISLLSNNILVRDLIETQGDVHHIFPKQYLKKNGFEKLKYNQEANYAFLDTQVNKSISDNPPCVYFPAAKLQCETKNVTVGAVTDWEELQANLAMNCIPLEVFEMDYTRYEEFLELRRKLMAEKIREYYNKL